MWQGWTPSNTLNDPPVCDTMNLHPSAAACSHGIACENSPNSQMADNIQTSAGDLTMVHAVQPKQATCMRRVIAQSDLLQKVPDGTWARQSIVYRSSVHPILVKPVREFFKQSLLDQVSWEVLCIVRSTFVLRFAMKKRYIKAATTKKQAKYVQLIHRNHPDNHRIGTGGSCCKCGRGTTSYCKQCNGWICCGRCCNHPSSSRLTSLVGLILQSSPAARITIPESVYMGTWISGSSIDRAIMRTFYDSWARQREQLRKFRSRLCSHTEPAWDIAVPTEHDLNTQLDELKDLLGFFQLWMQRAIAERTRIRRQPI